METRKDKYVVDYKAIAEKSTLKAEIRDPEFWKEYLRYSWRWAGFVALLVVASNYDMQEGLLGSLAHIPLWKWAVVTGAAFFLGPAAFWLWATAFFKIWEWIDGLRSTKRDP